MFRSLLDNHQGDTILVLTSVTKILMWQHACCNVCVGLCLVLLLLCCSSIKIFVLSKTLITSPTCFGHYLTIIREILYLS